jgi:hypothetical protein
MHIYNNIDIIGNEHEQHNNFMQQTNNNIEESDDKSLLTLI